MGKSNIFNDRFLVGSLFSALLGKPHLCHFRDRSKFIGEKKSNDLPTGIVAYYVSSGALNNITRSGILSHCPIRQCTRNVKKKWVKKTSRVWKIGVSFQDRDKTAYLLSAKRAFLSLDFNTSSSLALVVIAIAVIYTSCAGKQKGSYHFAVENGLLKELWNFFPAPNFFYFLR